MQTSDCDEGVDEQANHVEAPGELRASVGDGIYTSLIKHSASCDARSIGLSDRLSWEEPVFCRISRRRCVPRFPVGGTGNPEAAPDQRLSGRRNTEGPIGLTAFEATGVG